MSIVYCLHWNKIIELFKGFWKKIEFISTILFFSEIQQNMFPLKENDAIIIKGSEIFGILSI